MMHRAWRSIEEVPYCFSRSYLNFQGHTALKIIEFHPNWAFPDCNSSLNSPMAMKCCTKLEIAQERCPIVFQGHSSNFQVTRYKTSSILTQIGRFRTIGRSQLSNPKVIDIGSTMMPCNYNHLTRDMRWMVLITIILYTCTLYNYNQFQGRHQQVISRIELARISNLRNWNWNWNLQNWNWNWNLLRVVELEWLELELKITELELNWKNGIDPNPVIGSSGVITNDQGKVHANGQGQRSKVKVTDFTIQLNRFRTVTPVWIHKWWWNDV